MEVRNMENAVAMTIQGYSAQQIIPAGWNMPHVVTVISKVLDTHNGWDAINKKYVVKVAGQYYITGSVQFMWGTSGYQCRVDILKNGATIALTAGATNPLGAATPICNVIANLNVNDYLQLSAAHDSPGTMVIQWAGTQLLAFCVGV